MRVEIMDRALQIQKTVQEILGIEEVYLVGGSVRDLVMGNEPKDYDFTTAMLPEEMVEKVKEAGRRVYTIGEKFGTIGFKVPVLEDIPEEEKAGYPNLEPFGLKPKARQKFEYVEVTTFRSEVYTSKSRKPEVEFVPSLDEDLARRDFTFNAMVLRSDGTIYDPYGGRLDIHAKQIKTVGMPKDRIMEDPLRIFRAARFAARYNFSIDPNFIGKARQLADRVFDVSVERWVQELDKLLTSEYSMRGLMELDGMGVMRRILPEVVEYNFFEQVKDPDEAWKTLLDNLYVDEEIKEPTRTNNFVRAGICARFKFSNDRTDIILGREK